MILESARVENFKCIDDSTEFSIRSLTALVGKNESGKTALLKALYRINPILPVDGSFLDTEYPRRRWAAYRQRKASAPDRVVTATWRLEEPDIALVNDLLGPDVLPGYTVDVTRGYDNRLEWHIDCDERRVVSNLMRRGKLESDELRSLWSVATLAELVQTLRAVETPSPAQSALLLEAEERHAGGPLAGQVAAMLEQRLPRFLYFAEYHRLPGEVSIDELMRRKAANELTVVDTIFLALLELANTTPEDLQNIDQFEYLVAELEAVSQRITRDVMEYWSQDRSLEVDFRCDAARPHDPPPFNTGYVMRTRIRNRRHRITLGFDERSAGFIWFFSFLVWLSHIRRDEGADYIILLDEPGLGLHARAQIDMMRFIREKLLPAHQVIYTTHSPFMIDGEHLDGLRTVEDSSDGETVLGTRVGDRVLSTDPDTLFPIRAALAYDVARRVVTGPQTLLVDRPSDVLYLKWFSRELQLQGRAHLAPAWSLVPVGGLDSIAPFVSLFAGQEQQIAVLTDGLMSHPHRLDGLWERGMLQFGRILRPALYTDREDAQLEDLLGRSLYRDLVTGAYGLEESAVLDEAIGSDARRLVADVEAYFASMPPWAPRFDSFAPAAYLFENTATLRATLPELDLALDRFEKLFRDLHSLSVQ
ncbi:MAG: AAA family ATPase [Vicinamibacterales bacterium]|jgi:energy-coupling factor transporter ATP-binding protein EcfA2|nr:AAA family ATPase [Vicinamibacterales bacterium]